MIQNILLIGSTIVFFFLFLYWDFKLKYERDKNKELQNENSRAIKRYLSLQSKLNSNRELLRKKKGLLEIQDKIIAQQEATIEKNAKEFKEMNELCNISNRAIVKYQLKQNK